MGAGALGVARSVFPERSKAGEADWPLKLVRAAERQIGETILYDPAYVQLAYPGGDVPRDRGVCTDVIVRAYREALGIDLQVLMHEDMKRNFAAYPRAWGLSGPDANIDHRRVPNLRAFFRRRGAELDIPVDASGFQPGDVVSQLLPGNLAHIAIVSDAFSEDGSTPLVIHNIGAGAQRENTLFSFKITGRYRFSGA